jgi:hypothetical protein
MKVIAYPAHNDPDDFRRHHLPEMVDRNFDTVLFPISEQTWQYNLANITEMRETAERKGLDTWAGPWGLCGMFGGEAISTYRPGTPEADLFFELWKADIIASGFRTVFLDEPRLDCDPGVLFAWYVRQRETVMPEITLTTSLADDTFAEMDDEQIKDLPVDSVGLSCYHWTTDVVKVVTRTLEWTNRLVTLRPHDNHVWVQGFDLPQGATWIPELVNALAVGVGVRDFGFWSFRGTRCVSVKTAADWEQVWDATRYMLP